jgi:hypothetical protein
MRVGFQAPTHCYATGFDRNCTVLGRIGSKFMNDHGERLSSLNSQRDIRPIDEVRLPAVAGHVYSYPYLHRFPAVLLRRAHRLLPARGKSGSHSPRLASGRCFCHFLHRPMGQRRSVNITSLFHRDGFSSDVPQRLVSRMVSTAEDVQALKCL